MGNPSIPSAETISAEDFNAYLTNYEDCIKTISASKASKPGDKPLAELDKYRYGDAVANFSGEKPRKQMGLDEVKILVNWKLRHGKFRPTLMKLISSNEPEFVKQTVHEASECYKEKGDVAASLNILTKLKGIGPATASLLLAVLDPERVIFFADEAFYWLCCGGKKAPIKYNAKEYQELCERTRRLCQRLKVKAVDIERVAFVIMTQQDSHVPVGNVAQKKGISPPPRSTGKKTDQTTKQDPKTSKVSPPSKSTVKRAEKQQLPVKRKATSGDGEAVTTTKRRSKRIQQAKEA